MRCDKCGSNYAAVRRTEPKHNGITIQYIHCAECKADYTVSEKVEPDFDYQAIMDIQYDGYEHEKLTLTLASSNGIIGILIDEGKYDFIPFETVYFYAKENYCWGKVALCYKRKTDDSVCINHVLDVTLNPVTCAQFIGQKPYQLRKEAIEGTVPELTDDFVNLLNECLLSHVDDESAISPPKQEKKSSGCYIATSVYGTYDCPQVWVLRRYRDYSLAETWFGRLFIRFYYLLSPRIVKWFGKETWFNTFWHKRLDLMVSKLKAQGVKDTPYIDKY